MRGDDPRREACRSAVYAALWQSCQTQAYRQGRTNSQGLAQARMEARDALAAHDRLALHRGRP